MSAALKPQGEAMYVASKPDREWLLNVQRSLHARSREHHDYVFQKLWGLVTDPRNLRIALARVARNLGRRTSGVDGVTVKQVVKAGADTFLDGVRTQLRAGGFKPSPARRVLIPKAGQPGKTRPLGIPTVTDRVVQAAMKNIMEPIFEADFYPASYGFRPGRGVHGALEHLRMLLRPREAGPRSERRLPYQWAIEGDIKGCFDNIDHHTLMVGVRKRIGDTKLNRLVLAFLRAGFMSENTFYRTAAGTPQGGILSPLLANIALATIEERYERHVWPRRTPTPRTRVKEIENRAMANRANDRRCRLNVFYPIRYADDFIILVSTPPGDGQEDRAREAAVNEKSAVAEHLRKHLKLELSETKTLVTSVTQPMRFLGHHVRVREHPTNGRLVSTSVIPKDRSQRLRELIKKHFARRTTLCELGERLLKLNRTLRGWGNFYRHAWGAKHVFGALDHYVWWTIYRWVRKKHKRVGIRSLLARYTWKKPRGRAPYWGEGDVRTFRMSEIKAQPYRLAWQRPPAFASTPMESPVHIERCTPGSAGGARKPADASRTRRRAPT